MENGAYIQILATLGHIVDSTYWTYKNNTEVAWNIVNDKQNSQFYDALLNGNTKYYESVDNVWTNAQNMVPLMIQHKLNST